MLALVLDEAPTLRGDHPEPERRPGEALVSMRLAGVCDTDLQLAKGYMGFRGVLGHEFVGQVLEADGAGWVGKRVVADINAGCGRCEDCRLADGHHCTARTVLGILGRDGAMAERLAVPERCLVAVPDSVPDECAVFAEPLAAALHVTDALEGVPADAPVAVVGDGKLGLLIALALRAAGRRVVAVGHHPHKLRLAASAGVETVLESELGAERFAAVVEATGSAAGLGRALSLTVPRGSVVLKTTISDSHAVDLSPIVINELSVVGSRCGDLARAIRELEAGSIDPTPLVAERYRLANAAVALERAAQRGMLKVLIEASRE